MTEVTESIEECPHCEKRGPRSFTRYIGFIDQRLCQNCWEDYLSERVDELITDFSISDILNSLAGHVGGLVDNIHDSYRAGNLDGEQNTLSYGDIVPVLEAPLEMAAKQEADRLLYEAAAAERQKAYEAERAIREAEEEKARAERQKEHQRRWEADSERRNKLRKEWDEKIRREQKERDEMSPESQKLKRDAIIEARDKDELWRSRSDAMDEASKQRWKKYNEHLIRQLELHGQGYAEQDIPTPPEYVTLDRDENGEPYLRVVADRFFTVPNKIYQYWIKYLLQVEKENDIPR